MDIVIYALAVFFGVIFVVRFFWFIFEFIGGFFWNLSSMMIFWTLAIFLFIVFAKSGI